MEVLAGAFHLVAAVIAVGGAAKIVSPDPFAGLLRSLGLPSRRSLAQLSGAVEVLLGTAGLLIGGTVVAALVAAAYAVFAVVVVLARRSGAESCGCFGAAAAPPGPLHVVVNAGSCAVALAAAIWGASPWVGEVLADQPAAGVPYLIAVGTGTWLVIALDTVGSDVLDRVGQVAALGPTFREHADHPRPRRRRARGRTGVTRA